MRRSLTLALKTPLRASLALDPRSGASASDNALPSPARGGAAEASPGLVREMTPEEEALPEPVFEPRTPDYVPSSPRRDENGELLRDDVPTPAGKAAAGQDAMAVTPPSALKPVGTRSSDQRLTGRRRRQPEGGEDEAPPAKAARDEDCASRGMVRLRSVPNTASSLPGVVASPCVERGGAGGVVWENTVDPSLGPRSYGKPVSGAGAGLRDMENLSFAWARLPRKDVDHQQMYDFQDARRDATRLQYIGGSTADAGMEAFSSFMAPDPVWVVPQGLPCDRTFADSAEEVAWYDGYAAALLGLVPATCPPDFGLGLVPPVVAAPKRAGPADRSLQTADSMRRLTGRLFDVRDYAVLRKPGASLTDVTAGTKLQREISLDMLPADTFFGEFDLPWGIAVPLPLTLKYAAFVAEDGDLVGKEGYDMHCRTVRFQVAWLACRAWFDSVLQRGRAFITSEKARTALYGALALAEAPPPIRYYDRGGISRGMSCGCILNHMAVVSRVDPRYRADWWCFAIRGMVEYVPYDLATERVRARTAWQRSRDRAPVGERRIVQENQGALGGRPVPAGYARPSAPRGGSPLMSGLRRGGLGRIPPRMPRADGDAQLEGVLPAPPRWERVVAPPTLSAAAPLGARGAVVDVPVPISLVEALERDGLQSELRDMFRVAQGRPTVGRLVSNLARVVVKYRDSAVRAKRSAEEAERGRGDARESEVKTQRALEEQQRTLAALRQKLAQQNARLAAQAGQFSRLQREVDEHRTRARAPGRADGASAAHGGGPHDAEWAAWRGGQQVARDAARAAELTGPPPVRDPYEEVARHAGPDDGGEDEWARYASHLGV